MSWVKAEKDPGKAEVETKLSLGWSSNVGPADKVFVEAA